LAEQSGGTPRSARGSTRNSVTSVLTWVPILIVAAVTLRAMGRSWWCECGSPVPWSWDIWSRHNSQHLLDPYTFTHVLHGVLFYAILHVILGRRTGIVLRGIIAMAMETLWEVAENPDTVIAAYRESTIAIGYYGDSVLNSLFDILACGVGFLAAACLPVWISVAGYVAIEVILLVWIRDNFLLSALMLVSPIEAIKDWQLRP
jgi:hypothetical protein